MKLAKAIAEHARKQMAGFCRVCPECNGKACAGEIPGMGGAGNGSSFHANIQALSRLRLEMRTLHNGADPKRALPCR